MSGPQTAQAKATLGASPSNFQESPCRKARSRFVAVLRPVVSTMREVSACSASRVRAPTGVVARHARCHPGEVGDVLEHAVRRIERHLDRCGLLGTRDERAACRAPVPRGEASRCVTRWVHPACGDPRGRPRRRGSRGVAAIRPAWPEARLRAPPIAQERVEHRPDGLVRITLKKAYRDGTVAVDMDPLSLLCRLASAKPPLGGRACLHHDSTRSTMREWPRARLRATRRGESMALARDAAFGPDRGECARSLPLGHEPEKRVRKSGYRPWAELLQRTFSVDVAQGQAPRFSLAPVARGG